MDSQRAQISPVKTRNGFLVADYLRIVISLNGSMGNKWKSKRFK